MKEGKKVICNEERFTDVAVLGILITCWVTGDFYTIAEPEGSSPILCVLMHSPPSVCSEFWEDAFSWGLEGCVGLHRSFCTAFMAKVGLLAAPWLGMCLLLQLRWWIKILTEKKKASLIRENKLLSLSCFKMVSFKMHIVIK